jgi:hypothetical protein
LSCKGKRQVVGHNKYSDYINMDISMVTKKEKTHFIKVGKMSQALSYRNIDSILRERKARVLITGSGSGTVNMSRLPENGEEVGVETDFAEYVKVEIHSSTDFGNRCHGEVKHHVYKGSPGDMELIVDNGEWVEFSHSKIYVIHRS